MPADRASENERFAPVPGRSGSVARLEPRAKASPETRLGFRLNLERAAIRITRLVGERWGESFPFYYVMEFPKSGGSWLADMIATYLGLPRPERPIFPVGFASVIHGHWRYSPQLRRVFYLHRDGRDVVVSALFRTIGELRDPPYRETRRYYRDRYPSLFDPSLPLEDTAALLPRFIAEWARRPGGSPLNWGEHIEEWCRRHPHVVVMSYESLLRDTLGEMRRALAVHAPSPLDPDVLELSVARHTFERRARRRRGDEARGEFLRKGVAGDWKNHFTREAGEVFDRLFGRTLIDLGYEADSGWVGRLPERLRAE
jgi:hypothetical protein